MASESQNVTVGQLEEAALRRKQRLLALKRIKQSDPDNKNSEINSRDDSLPKPIFRSYNPRDETLKENAIPKAVPGSVEEQVKDQIEAAKTRQTIEGLDLTNLAPRKPDWDLKRDVAKKLEKLERRTQRAIAELIHERLKVGNGDLATAVNSGVNKAQVDAESDED